jgi:hypothetical protein
MNETVYDRGASGLARAASSGTAHLASLPSGFGVWRCAECRTAGFPAHLVLRLSAPELARQADALLDAEDAHRAATERMVSALSDRRRGSLEHDQLVRVRRAYKRAVKGKLPAPEDVQDVADAELDAMRSAIERVEAEHRDAATLVEEALRAASHTLREVACDARFREAVTWQNRKVVHTTLDALARRSDSGELRKHDRRHEELVAKYLHRYCVKNDTIGFFGPTGWAHFDANPDAPRVAVRPGPSLLASRGVYFEQWGIDAVAEMLSNDARFRPWIPPRRFGFVRLDGAVAHSPVNGRHALPKPLELVLRACDGVTPARDVARALVAEAPRELPDEASVFAALDALCEMQLVAWSLAFGTTWEPDKELRVRIQRFGDPALRAQALAPLDALEGARRDVAAAAGDPDGLARALDALDETFTRITGAAATRNAGMMYAARSLVFEDCLRDVDVRFGKELLDELGPALSLVLTSARWFTFEVKKTYEAAFRALYDEMVQKSGSPRLPLSDFWVRAQRGLRGKKDRPVDATTAELRARWDRIFGPPTDPRRVQYDSEALRPRVEAAFDAPASGWPIARHHAPDFMICASSVEAIARGDYSAVLGEIHAAYNTLDQHSSIAQHPAPEELMAALVRDVPEARVIYVPAKHATMAAVRVNRGFFGPNAYTLETGFEASTADPDRTLRLGDLVVEARDGELVVTGPYGVHLTLVDVLGQMLTEMSVNELELGSTPDHAPRVTVDRLVVRRESWRALPSELSFAYAASNLELFVGARRWARSLELPRFVFVKSPHEVKPMYVDFDSLVSLRLLAKIIRQAKEHVSGEQRLKFTEMLPALDQLWFPDHAGSLYTAEIRIVGSDQRRI